VQHRRLRDALAELDRAVGADLLGAVPERGVGPALEELGDVGVRETNPQ
jgi:hypothetical protein